MLLSVTIFILNCLDLMNVIMVCYSPLDHVSDVHFSESYSDDLTPRVRIDNFGPQIGTFNLKLFIWGMNSFIIFA
jgi:hypothetical protein